MTSQIQKLAAAVRDLAERGNPVETGLHDARRGARALTSALPSDPASAAIAEHLRKAASSADQASEALGHFRPGAREFADRLANGGPGGGRKAGGVHWGNVAKTSAMMAPAMALASLDLLAESDGLGHGISEAIGLVKDPLLRTGLGTTADLAPLAKQVADEFHALGITDVEHLKTALRQELAAAWKTASTEWSKLTRSLL